MEVLHLNLKFQLSVPGFSMFFEAHECRGDEFDAFPREHVTPERCFERCKRYTTVFAFGRLGTDRCNLDGCKCFCQNSSTDGECGYKSHDKYDLYRTNPMRADSKLQSC